MLNTTWVKSSWSYANGNCVEVRALADSKIEVRNSRMPDVRLPPFTCDEWQAFIAGARAGEFDQEHLAGMEESAGQQPALTAGT
jgi:predicted secreted Zn-dependent protease